MARKASVETGIELSADGVRQVGAEFSKLGRNVVQSAEQIRKITDFVRNFKEIGRAAFDVAREALTRLLDVTLEYRDANDAQVKELTKAANSVKVLASRIGDALIPVIQGLSRALGPVITETTKWLEANREWLALEIVENMAALAGTLAGPVVRGVQGVVGATTALSAGWVFVEKSVNQAIATILDGAMAAVSAAGSLADKLGLDGIAGQARDAENALVGMSFEFRESARDAQAELDVLIAQLVANDNTAENVLAKITEIIKGFRQAAKEAAAASKASGTTTQEAADQAVAFAEKIGAAMAAGADAAIEGFQNEEVWIQRLIKDEELLAKAAEDRATRIQKANEAMAQTATASGAAIGAALSAGFEEGEFSAQKAMKAMALAVFRMVRQTLEAELIRASGSLFASLAALGPGALVGIPAGVAALGALFEGLISQIPTAHTGAIVKGPSSRETLVMVRGGEAIVPLTGPGSAGVGGTTYVFNVSNNVPTSVAEASRVVRRGFLPALRRAQMQGAG